MEPINIEIPQELFSPAEFKHYEDVVNVDLLTLGPEIFSFKEPLRWQVDIANTGEGLLVSGTVEGVATCNCSRCLEEMTVPLSGDIEGYFLLSHDEQIPEDLEEDEFDYLGEDKVIDMAPLIHSALVLDMPPYPLCSDECKGLCPECGANLNEGPCGCEGSADPFDEEANPFAKLKELRFEG